LPGSSIAERCPNRTEENVATASTSVPPAVASEAIVDQSAIDSAAYSQPHGAARSPARRFRDGLPEAFLAGEVLTVDLLYGDHEGGQLTISRFILSREDDGHWRPGVVRHWALEGTDPRVR
jgi:hypothetical protein